MFRKRIGALFIVLLAIIGSTAPSFAIDETVTARKTRPGVKQLFLLASPTLRRWHR